MILGSAPTCLLGSMIRRPGFLLARVSRPVADRTAPPPLGGESESGASRANGGLTARLRSGHLSLHNLVRSAERLASFYNVRPS